MKRNTTIPARGSLLLTVCLALVLVLAISGCSATTSNGSSGKTADSTQAANPVKNYDSLAEAEKAAGFRFTVPEGVNMDGADYAQYYWSTINGDLIEVRYGGEGDEVCYMRKANADDLTDISGDYNVYDDVKDVDITLEDGRETTVTLKGQGDKFYLAVWQQKGAKDNGLWNYAIGVRGTLEQDLLELVKMVE